MRLGAPAPLHGARLLCGRPAVRVARSQYVPARLRRRLALLRRSLVLASAQQFDQYTTQGLEHLLMRLCEDDVDYADLKAQCKLAGVPGGRDSKENLRARLIRYCRQQLGMDVFAPESADPAWARRAEDMSPSERAEVISAHGVIMPSSEREVIGVVNALLLADGIIKPADLISTSSRSAAEDWQKRTVAELKQECSKRKLSTKGLKSELINRLMQWESDHADDTGDEGPVQQHMDANVGVMPTLVAPAELAAAHQLLLSLRSMSLEEMRLALRKHGLPWSGKREVLLAQLSLAARKQVVAAMGGEARLAQHAELAVNKLSDQKVKQQLAELAPGSASAQGMRSSSRELREQLQRVVVNKWVEDAMRVGPAQPAGEEAAGEEDGALAGEAAQLGRPSSVEQAMDEAEEVARRVLAQFELDSYGSAAGAAGLATEDAGVGEAEDAGEPLVHEAFIFGPPDDPTITLALLVGGATLAQRESALAAARLAVHYLQSDAYHGTLPAHQLERGSGAERQAVATQVFYCPGGADTKQQQHQQQGYVQLTWEQLFGSSASELDVLLGTPQLGAASPASLADIAAEADVVLPLGAAAEAGTVAGPALDPKLLGSLAAPEAASLAADSVRLSQRLAELGYPAAPLRRLELAACRELATGVPLEESAACQDVSAWMTSLGLDTTFGRMAVRAEAGGAVLGATVVAGAVDVLQAALLLMDEHSVDSVVLEAVVPGAVYVTVSVLGGEHGPVALPPTELSFYDLEDDVAAAQMDFERFLAVREGLDLAGTNALLSLMHRESIVHPGYLGARPATPTQQLRHVLPPRSLSAELVEALRLAAVKAFSDLGLRDYAQFSGWVLPTQQQRSEVEQALSSFAAGALGANTNGSTAASSGGRRAVKSFAELQAIDEAARATGAASLPLDVLTGSSAGGRGDAVSAEDRAEAVDVDSASVLGGSTEVVPPQLDAEFSVTYGKFKGIEIDDSTRLEWMAAHPADIDALRVPADPDAPEPNVVVESLPDPSSSSPEALCRVVDSVIAFTHLSLVPDLGDPGSVVFQQAAAAGVSHECLLRELVSAAARRAGLLALPHLPVQAAPPPAPPAEPQEDDPDLAAVREILEFDFSQVESFLQAEEEQAAEAAGEEGSAAEANGSAEQEQAWQEEQQEVEAPLTGSYADDPLADNDWASDDPEQLEQAGPSKQPVWVLFGGDGPERQASLAGGLHAYLHLRADPLLDAEAFMLEPTHCGQREEERRRELLDRRLDLMKLGMEESFMLSEYPHFHLTRIRNPPPSSIWRSVWRLSGSAPLRASVEDMHAACERALKAATASPYYREEAEVTIPRLLLSAVQQELGLAGLAADGSLWGAAPPEGMQPPRSVLLQQFVEDAFAAGAVVLLALGRESMTQGAIQQQLEAAGVPCTASVPLATEICEDRAALVEQLRDLEPNGISTPPQHKVSLPELRAQCEDEAGAERYFRELCRHLNASSLSVRPAMATAAGQGLMEAGCGADLAVYAAAVDSWAGVIPAEALSRGQAVQMAFPPPTHLVVEPLIRTDPLLLRRAADGSLIPPQQQQQQHTAASSDGSSSSSSSALGSMVHWEGGCGRWLEVSAHLLGEAGQMRCLGPSAWVYELQQESGQPSAAGQALEAVQQQLEERYEEAAALMDLRSSPSSSGGSSSSSEAGDSNEQQQATAAAAAAEEYLVGGLELTPPPPSVVQLDAVQSAKLRLMLVADRLGISGVARVDALMHADTGEVVVMDVQTCPDLSPGSLLFRQAAAEDPPMAPAEVFRELIRISVSKTPEPDLLPQDMAALGGYASGGDVLADGEEGLFAGMQGDVSSWPAPSPLEFEEQGL